MYNMRRVRLISKPRTQLPSLPQRWSSLATTPREPSVLVRSLPAVFAGLVPKRGRKRLKSLVKLLGTFRRVRELPKPVVQVKRLPPIQPKRPRPVIPVYKSLRTHQCPARPPEGESVRLAKSVRAVVKLAR